MSRLLSHSPCFSCLFRYDQWRVGANLLSGRASVLAHRGPGSSTVITAITWISQMFRLKNNQL